MTQIAKIEAAMQQLTQDVHQMLDKLENMLPRLNHEDRVHMLELTANRIFDKDSDGLSVIIKEFGKNDYLDVKTLTAINSVSSLVFKMAAKRFYFLAANFGVEFSERMLGYKLSRIGHPEAASFSVGTTEREI